MNTDGLFTILVPTYDVEPAMLVELLDSIVENEEYVGEIVVRDDCSSFDYSASLDKYFEYDFFSYEKNLSNLGMVGNWNQCLTDIRHEFFMVFGQDDIMEKDTLREIVEYFSKNPSTVCTGLGCKEIDGDSKQYSLKRLVNHRNNIFKGNDRYKLSGKEATYLSLRNGCAIGELSCVAYRASLVAQGLRFDSEFSHSADIDFTICSGDFGSIGYMNDVNVKRRFHSKNLTIENYRSGLVSSDREKMFYKHAPRFSWDDGELEYFKARLFFTSLMDLAFSIRSLTLSFFIISVKRIFRYFPNSWSTFRHSLFEIVKNVNLDQR